MQLSGVCVLMMMSWRSINCLHLWLDLRVSLAGFVALTGSDQDQLLMTGGSMPCYKLMLI